MTFLVCLVLGLFPASDPGTAQSPALLLWEAGQQAMLSGRTDEALDLYQASLKLEPTLSRNYLSLAAGYLEKGDDKTAAQHMDRYLQLEPEHHTVRAHYAELLIRLNQLRLAREQLERLITDAQEDDELAGEHLVSSHSQLMSIARTEEDEYGEHLHRGIGLFWLACQRATLAEDALPLNVESLLCRAAAELSLARSSRPDEARPSWYLYEVWTRLAQSQPAQCALRAADAAAPLTFLTPAEHRGLILAVRQARGERSTR